MLKFKFWDSHMEYVKFQSAEVLNYHILIYKRSGKYQILHSIDLSSKGPSFTRL